MRPRVLIVGMATIAGAMAMVACGSNSPTSTQDPAGATAATCVRGPTNTPPPTLKPGQLRTPLPPDLRPDSTRMAEIDQFRKRRFDATSQLIASGCDPRNLPMAALTHNDGAFPHNLGDALQQADLVVTAHVTSTKFSIDQGNPVPTADTTLIVDERLKGDAPREITLFQEGGPIPDNGGLIGIIEGDPVLLRGDDVLLLAQKRTNADGYWSIYPVGKYYIREGVVSVPDGSPCDWINSRSLNDVLRVVRASLSHDSQEAAQPCDWSRFKG